MVVATLFDSIVPLIFYYWCHLWLTLTEKLAWFSLVEQPIYTYRILAAQAQVILD